MNIEIRPHEMHFALRCHGKDCHACIALKLTSDAEHLVIALALNGWIVWGTAEGGNNIPIGRMYCDDCAIATLPMPMVIVARAMNRRIQDAYAEADKDCN